MNNEGTMVETTKLQEEQILDIFVRIYINIFIAYTTKMKVFTVLSMVEKETADACLIEEEESSKFLLNNFEEKIIEAAGLKDHEEFLSFIDKKFEKEPFIKASTILKIFQEGKPLFKKEEDSSSAEISLKELEDIIDKVRN